MAEQRSDRNNSNSQLLQELDALSQTLYQSHAERRAASFVLPRSASPSVALSAVTDAPPPVSVRPRSRRMSMSPFRSRPKSHQLHDGDDDTAIPTKNHSLTPLAGGDKKGGIWSWKPMRALSHIGMQRLGCLFSVEVVAVQGLPPSMNGLRLSVAVRKKETRDGAVQTMPARVQQGAADLEETLFIRCHVYCSGKPPKFEPRPFLVYALAIDAPELDFGRSTVDLSLLVQESMERNLEGTRIRQWDVAFPLTGKAKGGELVIKLGFQIMEDGGVGIYNQAAEGTKKESRGKGPAHPSSPVARGQSKSSFSVSSPRITRAQPPVTPSNSAMDLKGIDDFNLDEPAPPPPPPPQPSSSSSSFQKFEPESKTDELDLPEFDVIDRGVEIEEKDKEEEEAAESEEAAEGSSVASEVVKEVVHDSAHQLRMTELDAIANQIKALESMVIGDKNEKDPSKTEQENSNQQLDAEEETVTKEFLQMLELEDDNELSFDMPQLASEINYLGAEEGADGETKSFLSDLGKGLGPVVQTRDGGYLASMNPLDIQVVRKDIPKLAMQLSKPVVLRDQKLTSGIEVFQKLAAVGSMEELSSKLASLASMDELTGKTAEQIAFEGMASVIISRRAKEGASSSAARSVAALKTMAAAMNDGRRERIATGIWNVKEEPVAVEEILPFVLQKIEVMAVEALKIQAEVEEEEAPFDVSLPVGKDQGILDSVALPEEWEKCCGGANEVTMLVLVQLRDPLRRYEEVGAPVIAVVQAARAGEGRFKVTSLHAGGMRIRSGGGTKSSWDGEKQRLTAMQWLVAYGLAKAGKKKNKSTPKEKGNRDMVWSLSSRVMADMWLKPIRNPDVKLNS